MHSETELQPRWRDGGSRRKRGNTDLLVMWKMMNVCFPVSAAALLG